MESVVKFYLYSSYSDVIVIVMMTVIVLHVVAYIPYSLFIALNTLSFHLSNQSNSVTRSLKTGVVTSKSREDFRSSIT